MPTRVFISAVSDELGPMRAAAASALAAQGIEPVYQEGWGLQSGALMRFLRKTIRSCDGIIHLAGYSFGRPIPKTLFTRGGQSFAQWEARLARKSGKPLYLLVKNVPGENVRGETEADRLAQTAHRDWCLHLQRINFAFGSQEQLIALVETLTPALIKAGSRWSRFRRLIRAWIPYVPLFAIVAYAGISLLGRWFLHDAQKFELPEQQGFADLYATKAVQILGWVPFLNSEAIHQALEKAASARVQTDQWAKALEYLGRLERVLPPKDARLAWVFHAQGRCHAAIGMPGAELQAINRQMEFSRQVSPPGGRLIVIALAQLSTNAVKRGDYNAALQFAQQAQTELGRRNASAAATDLTQQREEFEIRGHVANAYFELASSIFQRSGGVGISPEDAAKMREECRRSLEQADTEYTRAIQFYRDHVLTSPSAKHGDFVKFSKTLSDAALAKELEIRCELASQKSGVTVDFRPILQMADKALAMSREAQERAEGHLSPNRTEHGALWHTHGIVNLTSGFVHQRAGRDGDAVVLMERAVRCEIAARERWLALPVVSYLRVPEASHQAAVACWTLGDARLQRGFIQRAYLDFEEAKEHSQAALGYVEAALGGKHRDLAVFRQYAETTKSARDLSLEAAQAVGSLYLLASAWSERREVIEVLALVDKLAYCCGKLGEWKLEGYYRRQALVLAVHFAKNDLRFAASAERQRQNYLRFLTRAGRAPADDEVEIQTILAGNERAEFRVDGRLLSFPAAE